MLAWRAYAVLLALAAAVLAASFGIGRALRSEPASKAPLPAPVVEARAGPLVELGPPAKLPALRPR